MYLDTSRQNNYHTEEKIAPRTTPAQTGGKGAKAKKGEKRKIEVATDKGKRLNAPDEAVAARTYGVARYGMDVQRHLSVLELHLADGKEYLVGGVYSLADMAVFPWVHQVRTGYPHKSGIKAAEFLNVAQYPKLNQWADRILAREQVKRAITVCSWATPDKPKPWL